MCVLQMIMGNRRIRNNNDTEYLRYFPKSSKKHRRRGWGWSRTELGWRWSTAWKRRKSGRENIGVPHRLFVRALDELNLRLNHHDRIRRPSVSFASAPTKRLEFFVGDRKRSWILSCEEIVWLHFRVSTFCFQNVQVEGRGKYSRFFFLLFYNVN